MTHLPGLARASRHVALAVATLALAGLAPFDAFAPSATAQQRPPHPQGQAPAAGPNPIDAEVHRLAAQVSQAGHAPRGVLPFLTLWQRDDWASPGVMAQVLGQLAGDHRLTAAQRAYVGVFVASQKLRDGDLAGAKQGFHDLGYVTTLRVLGPFDNEGKAGFDRATPPEEHTDQPSDPNGEYPGRERPVHWRTFPDVAPFAYIDLDAVYRPNENTCAIAETFVQVARARTMSVWAGGGGAIKVYWNGIQVIRDEKYRGADPDRDVAVVNAVAGWNRVLVKSCTTSGAWGFYLRLGEADGSPAQGVTLDASQTLAPHGPAVQPRQTLTTPLATLEAAAAGDHATPGALEDLARFLSGTAADDPAERRAKQLAAHAAEAGPTIDNLRLAASLAGDERGDVMKFAAKAAQLAANDPRVLLLLARVKSTGPVEEDALPIVARIPTTAPEWVDGQILRAAILRDLDLDEAARSVTRQLAATSHGSVGMLRELANAADSTSRVDEALEARTRLVAARYDDVSARRALIADALQRGDAQAGIAQAEVLRTLAPGSARNLFYIAAVYDGFGRDDEVLAAYRAALEIAPEDASTFVAMGRALLRVDQRDAAADAFHHALAVRPQDADTRELLESLAPQARQDEAFAAAQDVILGRRSDSTEYPVNILQNLTVNTVFDNGLGSSFHQIAMQVHDTEGARAARTYPIQFDPESQRVDVRLARVYRHDGTQLDANQTFEQPLGEPWYRIYYDTRALIVVFPDLTPGDTIELRYRVDDVAHRNVFADYYGDLQHFQDAQPIDHVEYVLISPATRHFYWNEPRMTGLTHTRETHEGKNVDRWTADHVAALQSEDGMPGYTEVGPYLHVSTYRTWEDVGRWWWGLVKDQLYADDSLKHTVADLVRGAPDVRTKVQRIYDWVVTHTRYVGLEFGIHGFLPYRVPQIVQRGFGDCKDKASLIYTMLREAGIDARMVLVRTRHNGNIGETPASLAIFDHAIAYVPELDMYLDGTAEHSGTTELPQGDQGVEVLRIGPNDVMWTRTPVLDPSHNRRERHIEAQVAADGSATVSTTENIIGSDAQGYRDVYQAEGTRRDRFERALSGSFPGAHVEDFQISDLANREQPIHLSYRAAVPQFALHNGTQLVLAPTQPADLLRSLARTPTRHHALDLGGTSSYVEDRVVHLPAGTTIAEAPPGGDASSPFGHVHMTVERGTGQITVHTDIQIDRDRIAPEDYAAFRQWAQQADALLRERIIAQTGGAQ